MFSMAALAALMSLPLAAQGTKIATISIQQALISTREGQKAAASLNAKFEPKKKELEGKQNEIQAMQAELSKGANTMAEAKRLELQRNIDAKTKSLQRDTQDAQEELQLEQNKLLDELGQRMMAVIIKYAQDNGIQMVVDVGNQQTTPVIWAANSIDITTAIVDLYDKNTPPPATSAAPAPAVVKPAAAAPPATQKKAAAPK